MQRRKIVPKKDLNKAYTSIKYEFTEFLLYDWNKKSYIERHRMWVKYKNKCKDLGLEYVSYHDFKNILRSIAKKIKHYLMNDPNGVKFERFTLKQIFVKTQKDIRYLTPIILLTNNVRVGKTTLVFKDWGFRPSKAYTIELNKKIKKEQINQFDYEVKYFKYVNEDLETELDLFNDFT